METNNANGKCPVTGAGFAKVAHKSLGSILCFTIAESQLERWIAVRFLCANLRYYAGACLNNCDCNVLAVLVIDTGHADFFANQTVHCVVIYMIERYVEFLTSPVPVRRACEKRLSVNRNRFRMYSVSTKNATTLNTPGNNRLDSFEFAN